MALVEVIGVDPPCKRCTSTHENTEKAASQLKKEGLEIEVKKLNITSQEVISKYGIIISPAIAVDGQVRISGRVPDTYELVKIIKEAL
ncbi:MAG: thioredoxin family protein [Candidatus Bathyarchaeota archaeon]|nr:thioredoxin family protein [Candidatus Bathyarchaeota archaeon]